MEYIANGISEINKNTFKPVTPILGESTKPAGGLWFTPYDKEAINANSWLVYLAMNWHDYFEKFRPYASIIELKDDAKIYMANTEEDFEQLFELYPCAYGDKIDYIRMAEDYDGLFFNYHYSYDYKYHDWACESLVLFNPDCVKHFKRATVNSEIDYTCHDIYFTMGEVGEAEPVKEQTFDFEPLIEEFSVYIDSLKLDELSNIDYFERIRKEMYIFISKFDEEDKRFMSSLIYHLMNHELGKRKGYVKEHETNRRV